MSTTGGVTRVTYRWDDQPGVEPGWYCESFDSGGPRDDSQKVWFPVRVDDFGESEGPELAGALQAAFPGADVVAL